MAMGVLMHVLESHGHEHRHEALAHEHAHPGLRKGLAHYGDSGFSLFLRKAFIKGAGYTDARWTGR
jgi:hypothetical protein